MIAASTAARSVLVQVFASRVLATTRNMGSASQLLGHSSIDCSQRYVDVSNATLSAMFADPVRLWQNGYMNPVKTNNDRLRELVDASGLSQPAALAVFNLGLGPAAYSINTFKAFLVRQDSPKFRPLKDELLAHAEKNFKLHIKSP